MNSVRIVADGGCDLPPDLVSQYQITVVPVHVSFGPEMVSSDHLTPAEFWARIERSGYAPGTSAPSSGAFEQAFRRLVDAGHHVVCLTLPGKYSGAFNAARLAALEFGDRVRVVDSGSLSLGMGLLVLQAAKDALAGQSAEAIQVTLGQLVPRTSVIFALNTIEWVRRGGRLNRIMPLIDRVARTLNVKPILEVTDGEFHLLGIARSTKGVLQRLEDEARIRLPAHSVAAAYTRGGQAASELVNALGRIVGVPPGEIMCAEAGPVFAAHAGPGALGAVLIRA